MVELAGEGAFVFGRPVYAVGGWDASVGHGVRKRNVELCKHVARRQRHLCQIRGIPSAENDPSIVRFVPQLVNHLGQLIHPLARVIRFRIHVLGAEMPPLKAVYGSQVPDFAVRETHAVEELTAAVAIPDFDAGS